MTALTQTTIPRDEETPNALMRIKDIATLLEVSEWTIRRYMNKGVLPPPLIPPPAVPRWSRSAIAKWIGAE